MPIYEYQCQECEHLFEKFQKRDEKVLRICPVCGKEKLQKLISSAAFHLKGSGWYVTDFKDKSSPPSTQKASTKDSKKASKDKVDSAAKSSDSTGSSADAAPSVDKQPTAKPSD